jgi:hypothetical protein
MTKKATKKPKVSPKRQPKLMAKLRASLKKAPKKATTFRQVRKQVEAALMPKAEPPKYSAPWRAGIDWAAAGRKAYETKMRNLAARQAGMAAQPPTVQKAAQALDQALAADKKNRRTKFTKQMRAAAPSVALKEEDTSGN